MNEVTTPPTQTLLPTQTRAHHKYGPSKMNYMDDCAGFMSQSGTSEAAEEGTFLHDLMDKMIVQVLKGRAKTTVEQVAGWVVKSHELTEDQIACLRFCCRRIDTFLAKRPTAVHTEISVRVSDVTGKELNHGFLDVVFIYGRVGIVVDFKFGWEPVRPAKDNLQGQNYTLGCFQKFHDLDRIGVEFIQPRLNWITSAVFERRDMHKLYTALSEVVERAEFVQKNPQDALRYMKAGYYCRYCALAGSCAALSNARAVVATKYAGLPTPPSFKGMELTKPEDLALARHWVDIVEQGLQEIKTRAFEVAEANGGELRCTLPDGKEIVYTIQERNCLRSLGSALDVAEALKDFCSPEEILGAAELAITKLEPIAKNALVTMAQARGEKLTKKAAWEQVESLLTAQGLLTQPDTKVRFLKQKKEVKQIENS